MIKKITKRQWTIIVLIIFAILLYFIIPLAIPLVVAFITALFLNPIVRIVQKRTKLNRKLAVIFVFLLFLIGVGFTGAIIVTKAIGQVVLFVEQVPSHFNQINGIYEKWENEFSEYAQNLPPEFVRQVTRSFEENLTALINTAKEIITLDNIAQLISKIPQYIISFLVYLIALFLFMLELPFINAYIYSLFTKKTEEKVKFMNARLANVLLGFAKAQILVSFIIFAVSLIGLFIIAPQVAIVMSIIIWIIDIIPIIGSIIVLGPWALYLFLAGNTSMAIKLSILAIVLLALRRIFEPKLMGQHIGLSPLATLIAMFLGFKIVGFLGLLLGPLLVIAITSAREAGIIKWELKI